MLSTVFVDLKLVKSWWHQKKQEIDSVTWIFFCLLKMFSDLNRWQKLHSLMNVVEEELHLELLAGSAGFTEDLVVVHHPVLGPQQSHGWVGGVDGVQGSGGCWLCSNSHKKTQISQHSSEEEVRKMRFHIQFQEKDRNSWDDMTGNQFEPVTSCSVQTRDL